MLAGPAMWRVIEMKHGVIGETVQQRAVVPLVEGLHAPPELRQQQPANQGLKTEREERTGEQQSQSGHREMVKPPAMPGSGTETVSRRVHDELRRQIVEGELAPGDRIPSERVLAEDFGVNRHAVREALKGLQAAGLIRITHGGATRVLDWRDAGGLEVLLDLGGDPLEPPAEIVRSVVEMRASIGVDAARLCASRASQSERDQVEQLGESAAAMIGTGDEAGLDEAFAAFWLAIVAGSGNIAYRLSLNSLLKAMLTFGDVADRIRPADPRIITRLGNAIGAGDPETAAEVAGHMLRSDIDRVA